MQLNDENKRNVRLGLQTNVTTDDAASTPAAASQNAILNGGEYSEKGRGDGQKSNHSNYFKRPPVDQCSSSFGSSKQHAATRFQSGPGPHDRQKRYPSSGRHYNQIVRWLNQTTKNVSTPNSQLKYGEKSCKYFKMDKNDPQHTTTFASGSRIDVSKINHQIVCQSKDSNECTNAIFGSNTENQYKSDKQNLDHNSDLCETSGNLEKLHLMTAADFDRDRYARYGVHESEIKDYVRTITYLNSIEYCANKFIKNKVVLVIRGGIGFLPLLCARNGCAKKVIVLEESACIEYARQIVKDNNYCHKITLIQSSVQNLKELPHGLTQVDVIVSDFMGDCIISQGDQMEQVIEARNRFLSPNGIMIPKSVSLYGQLSDQRRAYENRRIRKLKTKEKKKNTNYPKFSKKKLESEEEDCDTDSSSDSTWCSWWKDVYGFDMRSKPDTWIDQFPGDENCSGSNKEWCVMPEPLIAFFDPCRVVSNACLMVEFNMLSCTIAEVRHVEKRNLKFECITPFTSANGGDYAHMLELFMIVDFPNGQELSSKDSEEIGFSTSCFSPCTRYRQTGLLLRDQLLVEEGDVFILNEFHMWRGPQKRQDNKLPGVNFKNKNSFQRSETEENLKLRLRYTFVNKYLKAVDRRCVYTLKKQLF